MPIKKATAAPRRAAPRRAKTPASDIQPIAAPEPESYASGTLLSREEKRQIILAHAAARRPTDPVQVTSMWLGVAVCAVIVAVGWWWAVKPEINKGFDAGLKPALAEASQTASEVGDSMQGATGNELIRNAADGASRQMQLIKEQAAAQADARRTMERVLSGTDEAASGTRDLFNPETVVTGTPAVQTEKPTETSKP